MIGPAKFPNGEERRVAAEFRAAGRRLVGHAAVFGEAADIGSFRETVARGAFTRTLASGHDVLALADHDAARLLGRTSSGTLRLAEDARGLAFEVDLPDTVLGRDMLALAERGDLGGMSFSFIAKKDEWPTRNARILHDVELIEVSVVTSFPAYQGTSVAARSAARFDDAAWRRRYLQSLGA